MTPANYRYPIVDVAQALMQVGEGVPYTQIARRIQSPHHPTYQRSSQLVRHWVDTFAPVVIAPHTETHWPRVIAVDSVPFYALGRRVAFSVLGVVGYEEQGDPGRVVALHLVTGAPKTPDWEALFGSLSGSPEMVITDRNGAQIAGVGIFPNTPMIRTCRWHELIDMRELLTRDNTAIPNAADAWETIRYAAHHEKEWQTLPADIAADLALWNPLQQRAFHRWYQNRYQRLTDDFRDGLPWGWTASKTEWALREVKNAIEYRTFGLRNYYRTSLLLELIRLRLNQADRRDAYIVAINDHLSHPNTQVPPQRIHNDPRGQPSLHTS